MKRPPAIPNTKAWQPRSSAQETLQSAFEKRCLSVEQRIAMRVSEEKNMNIDHFDSGAGVEDIVRQELSLLLPGRYHVTRGVVIDSNGMTAGDVDVTIFNQDWFPEMKSGATKESRRMYFPIEGVYAIGEVKQTLTYQSFDAAMEKLVIGHRLKRTPTCKGRLVENRESSSCTHGLSNPLYSFILAASLDPLISFEDLANRFYEINRTLNRSEVVRAFCVLNQGTLTWGYYDNERSENRPAMFMLKDLYEPVFPIMHKVPTISSALAALLQNLLSHLFDSVLAPEDLAALYGNQTNIQIPKSADISLKPDPKRLESLSVPCKEHSCLK